MVTDEGVTPLMIACQHADSIDVAKVLLKAAEEQNVVKELIDRASDDDISCVHMCTQEGNDVILAELLNYAPDVNHCARLYLRGEFKSVHPLVSLDKEKRK